MNAVLPEATVYGYQAMIPSVNLPDAADRHVVAAAMAGGASLILTWNLKHFPANELNKFGLRSETPDAFMADLYDEVPELTIGSLANARRNLNKSRVSAQDFVALLNNQRLIRLARQMQAHLREL